jgi:hypothetical protein
MDNIKNYIDSDVYYIDNFLPVDFIDDLNRKLLKDSWAMHNSSSDDKNFFWFLHLSGKSEYFNECNFISSLLPENEILRIYANGQSGIQHGNFHEDDGERTFLIGLTKNWSVNSGGATEFLKENQSSFSIYPYYNRMISFPSNIKHRALPNIDLDSFRMSLAIKTNYKQNKKIMFM